MHVDECESSVEMPTIMQTRKTLYYCFTHIKTSYMKLIEQKEWDVERKRVEKMYTIRSPPAANE